MGVALRKATIFVLSVDINGCMKQAITEWAGSLKVG